MQQKTVSKYTKEQTCEFAKEVLFRHYGSRATQIKYIGGGSFGYVYKVELPVMPYTLTVKACRVAGLQIGTALPATNSAASMSPSTIIGLIFTDRLRRIFYRPPQSLTEKNG